MRLVKFSGVEALLLAYNLKEGHPLTQKLQPLYCKENGRQMAEVPVENYLQILEVLAQELYPELPQEDAFFRIGQEAVEGYRQTILGRIQFAAAKIVSPNKIAKIAPANTRQNSNFGEIRWEELAPTKFRYIFEETPVPIAFVAGNFLAALKTTRARKVRVSYRTPGFERGELIMEWEEN